MSAKQKTPASPFYQPTSLKDAGYKGAQSVETLAAIAAYVMTIQPDVSENGLSVENKAGLTEGWMLRYGEINPGQRYTKEWNPLPADAPAQDGEMLVTVHFAMSFTQQEFGKFKGTDPGKYGAVQPVREKFQKYCANRVADLMAQIKRIVNESKPRTRVQAKDYANWLSGQLDEFKSRAKTAKSRGDATAPDEVKLRMAIDAFRKALG